TWIPAFAGMTNPSARKPAAMIQLPVAQEHHAPTSNTFRKRKFLKIKFKISHPTHPMLPRKFKNLKFRPNQHTRCPMPIEIPHTNKKVPKIGTKTDNFRHY
ncbi:TPA: hypothetical protein ACFM59_002166, partial [Neisseria meningitidis]